MGIHVLVLLSLSVCVSACAKIVYTHINRYSYCMRVVKKASSLHNKPISCVFKMPFMKHVLAFMHIKLVSLPSKNKLAKGIQSATINWHKHTRTCTQIQSANPFLWGIVADLTLCTHKWHWALRLQLFRAASYSHTLTHPHAHTRRGDNNEPTQHA